MSPPRGHCSPKYNAPSKYGRFTVQQSGKNHALQWGIYPAAGYSGTYYHVAVRMDGHKVDEKMQTYPPHGSVNANNARKYSGTVIAVSGNVAKGSKTVLVFTMECRVA